MTESTEPSNEINEKNKIFYLHCESFADLMIEAALTSEDFQRYAILTKTAVTILGALAVVGESEEVHRKYLQTVTKLLAEAYKAALKEKKTTSKENPKNALD